MHERQVMNARIVVEHNGEFQEDVEQAVASIIKDAIRASEATGAWPISVEVTTTARED